MIFKKISIKLLIAMLLIAMFAVALVACDLFHEHSFGEWVVTTEATCTTVGVKTKTCECGETQTEEIAIIPHTWVDATCEKAKTCSACQATEGEALGHTWVDATCTAPKTCSVCEATEGEKIDHVFVDGVCDVCEYEDPCYKEIKLGEKLFSDLLSIGVSAEKIGNYVYKAWSFYIYEYDDLNIFSDGMSEFARETGLSKTNVEKATVEYLTYLGFADDGISDIEKHSVLGTLSGCIFVANRACELAGLTDGVSAKLDEIKAQLKTMSTDYESETGLSILKDMYLNVSSYYNYVTDPDGNYNQYKEKVDNYTDKILDNVDELNYIYD